MVSNCMAYLLGDTMTIAAWGARANEEPPGVYRAVWLSFSRGLAGGASPPAANVDGFACPGGGRLARAAAGSVLAGRGSVIASRRSAPATAGSALGSAAWSRHCRLATSVEAPRGIDVCEHIVRSARCLLRRLADPVRPFCAASPTRSNTFSALRLKSSPASSTVSRPALNPARAAEPPAPTTVAGDHRASWAAPMISNAVRISPARRLRRNCNVSTTAREILPTSVGASTQRRARSVRSCCGALYLIESEVIQAGGRRLLVRAALNAAPNPSSTLSKIGHVPAGHIKILLAQTELRVWG